jgi:hypothetical protein
MDILWQLIHNLPPHGRRRRSGEENPLIRKKGLPPEIQDKLQAVNNSHLIAFAFCPPQQQDRQAMRLFHRIYIQDHRAIGYTLSMFTWIRLIKKVIYYPIQLESISWSLASFFNQFSIALWISPIHSLSVPFCAEDIALNNHTTSNYRYVRSEGV